MICGLGLMVLATSCDNFLDVHPKGEIVGKDLLSERKGFENALYGVYASMRNDKAYGAYMTYYVMDVLAQYFNCPGNSDITDLSAFKYKENPEVTKVFSDIWSTMYQNISYANNILVNLENQSPETLEFYDIYKGEALGLRAYMHFDLLRLYADQATDAKTRGIVYNTAFSLKPSDILPKTKVYERIIADLRAAEKLLDNEKLYEAASPEDGFFLDQSIHFNLQAARATLARVYLTQGNIDSAFYYADKVIREGGLELVEKTEIAGDVIGALSQKETIFGLYAKESFYTRTKEDLYDAVSFKSLNPWNGIATVYQEVNLCTNLSVGENVMLGHEKRGPFGIDWKREQKAVEAEAAKGELGRFAPGLPKISDGQQLFVLNGLSKLAPGGKMAIIQNGSPLFAGDAGSGPSNIRQYILENDWLDAIVQLSTDQFMNTGISTYIWVLCKDKPTYRCGKVQLIDASHCYEQRRKAIGTKRNDISDHCRELIVQAYGEYRNNAVYGDKSGVYCESKIFGSEEFGYNKIVVERPQRDENGEIVMKRGKPVADAALRDTENVPLVQDIDAYFAREVLPYAPDAWIDKGKTKVGYEIPMTRYFYEYQPPEPVDDIVERIQKLEREIADSLNTLFHKEG